MTPSLLLAAALLAALAPRTHGASVLIPVNGVKFVMSDLTASPAAGAAVGTIAANASSP